MSLKFDILGDPRVGKSTLANWFETYGQQIEIDGKTWKLERAHVITEAHCCVLVFDVNNRNSFLSLASHMDNFAITAHPNPYYFKYIVLGNKTDKGSRVVSTEEALEWCSNNREALYFDTSAKEGWNVDIAFDHIIRAAISYSSSLETTGPQIYNLQDLLVHDLLGTFFESRSRWLYVNEYQLILDHLGTLRQYASKTPNYYQPGLFLTFLPWKQEYDDLAWTNHQEGEMQVGEGRPNLLVRFACATTIQGRNLERFIYEKITAEAESHHPRERRFSRRFSRSPKVVHLRFSPEN